MKVYVGQFRFINEGHVEVLLATTESKMQELLTDLMLDYIQWENSLVLPPQQNYGDLTDIGYNNEWFEVTYDIQTVHSDGHILKHIMETI